MTARVLVFGGIDPSGGAGLSADIRTLQVHGAMALPIATCLTVQNRRGVTRVEPVEAGLWEAALQAAIADGPVHAVKSGLLCSADQVERLARLLDRLGGAVPLVVDPVLAATAGGFDAGAAVARAHRRWLVPRATVFTPNLPELDAVLGGDEVRALLADGCRAVLQKGGHGTGARLVDRLWWDDRERVWEHDRLPTGPVHGTGCALASAVAAQLACGRPVPDGCDRAIRWLQRCLAALPPQPAGERLPRPLPIVAD